MPGQKVTVSELQTHLEKHLRRAQKKNPLFTASALAKQLDMHETTLHKILRGERNLGYRLAKDIAKFFELELAAEPPKPKKRAKISQFELDSPVRASWVHLAILELIKLKDFQPQEKWIAHRLGLPVEIIKTNIAEMERAQILRRTGNEWIDGLENASTHTKNFLTSESLRALQRDVLALSTKAVDTIRYEERDHSMTIMPVPLSMMSRLKTKIRKFNWELSEMAQASKDNKDELYILQIGLFPITNSLTPRN